MYKRNQNVVVERKEYDQLSKKVLTERITMDYGTFVDVTESPEYRKQQDDESIRHPLTLTLIGEAEAPGKKSAKKQPAPVAKYLMKHQGGGKYNIFDPEGEKVNEAPMKKAEAEAQLNELNK